MLTERQHPILEMPDEVVSQTLLTCGLESSKEVNIKLLELEVLVGVLRLIWLTLGRRPDATYSPDRRLL